MDRDTHNREIRENQRNTSEWDSFLLLTMFMFSFIFLNP